MDPNAQPGQPQGNPMASPGGGGGAPAQPDPSQQAPQQPQGNPMSQPPQGQPQSPLEQYSKIYEDLRNSLIQLMHQGMPGIDKILAATQQAQSDLVKQYHPVIGGKAGGLASTMGSMGGGGGGQMPQAPQGQ